MQVFWSPSCGRGKGRLSGGAGPLRLPLSPTGVASWSYSDDGQPQGPIPAAVLPLAPTLAPVATIPQEANHKTSTYKSLRGLVPLLSFETQEHAPEAYFIVIIERCWCLCCKTLAIDVREIGTIFVLNHVLAIFQENARV
jgi:hypothetical protein